MQSDAIHGARIDKGRQPRQIIRECIRFYDERRLQHVDRVTAPQSINRISHAGVSAKTVKISR